MVEKLAEDRNEDILGSKDSNAIDTTGGEYTFIDVNSIVYQRGRKLDEIFLDMELDLKDKEQSDLESLILASKKNFPIKLI